MTEESRSSYDVEIPTLKSLFIETYRGDLKLGSGTAILAARDQQSHCALITNRHIVTGRHQETGQPLHTMGALPDAIIIYFHKNGPIGEWVPIRLPLYKDDNTAWWIEHPRLGANADVVSLNLRWGNDVHRLPYYLKHDIELDRGSMVIAPADIVSVIGFPFGLSSALRFPIWATGFLAQELSLVTSENPSFLIDCRARQGQSGAAVIAYRAGNYRRKEGDRIVSTLSPRTAWEFLGVYSGRVNSESDLGRVWHVTAIEELLDAAEAAMPKSPPETVVPGILDQSQ